MRKIQSKLQYQLLIPIKKQGQQIELTYNQK